MSSKLVEAARQWVAKAQEDWDAVQILSAHQRPPRSMVCFHCQQYVKKLMKALLTLNGVEAPRTHNLRRLIQLSDVLLPQLTLMTEIADALSAHGVHSRYPDDSYVVDNVEMRWIIKAANQFAEVLMPVLKESC